VPVEEELVGADEEGAGAAGGVEDGEGGVHLGRFGFEEFYGAVFQEFADGVLDDVIDDVGGGVVNAAGFFDFGFVFDFGAVGFGEGDDFAEELFIDLTEDVGGEDGEFVGGVGIVEIFEDVL